MSYGVICPVYILLQTELNPVENAIDTVNDNLQTLQRLYNRVMKDRNQSTNPLTMKLNGTLDAAVNGGLRLYEVFFTEEYQQQNPDHVLKIVQLRKAMQELVSELAEMMIVIASIFFISVKFLGKHWLFISQSARRQCVPCTSVWRGNCLLSLIRSMELQLLQQIHW